MIYSLLLVAVCVAENSDVPSFRLDGHVLNVPGGRNFVLDTVLLNPQQTVRIVEPAEGTSPAGECYVEVLEGARLVAVVRYRPHAQPALTYMGIPRTFKLEGAHLESWQKTKETVSFVVSGHATIKEARITKSPKGELLSPHSTPAPAEEVKRVIADLEKKIKVGKSPKKKIAELKTALESYKKGHWKIDEEGRLSPMYDKPIPEDQERMASIYELYLERGERDIKVDGKMVPVSLTEEERNQYRKAAEGLRDGTWVFIRGRGVYPKEKMAKLLAGNPPPEK